MVKKTPTALWGLWMQISSTTETSMLWTPSPEALKVTAARISSSRQMAEPHIKAHHKAPTLLRSPLPNPTPCAGSRAKTVLDHFSLSTWLQTTDLPSTGGCNTGICLSGYQPPNSEVHAENTSEPCTEFFGCQNKKPHAGWTLQQHRTQKSWSGRKTCFCGLCVASTKKPARNSIPRRNSTPTSPSVSL